jgi:hypothetical protein
MAKDTLTATIGPIGYETGPQKIRAAFAKGCSGVIVDGQVPAAATAEIAAMEKFYSDPVAPFSLPIGMDLFRSADENLHWQKMHPQAEVTQSWLMEKARDILGTSLRPAFDRSAGYRHQNILAAWWQGQITRGWHQDDQEDSDFPDIHLHIHGPGMIVAAPVRPTQVPLNRQWQLSPPRPKSLKDLWRSAQPVDPDQYLQDLGFELISLQPGQSLMFKDRCLHRSADYSAGQLKFRAAMISN